MSKYEKYTPKQEQETDRITALESIDTMLSENLEKMYDLMNNNQHVKESGYEPTIEQFQHYFEIFKNGLNYLKSTYGGETLPKNITLYQGVMKLGDKSESDFIGYLPKKDELAISFLHIAGQSFHYNNSHAIFSDGHLPEGVGVTGESYTLLQAIEEGYHRYQKYGLGKDMNESTERKIGHPLEAEIISVFEKAIVDFDIKLYYLENNIDDENI